MPRHCKVRIVVPGDVIEANIERPEVAIDIYNAITQQRESLLYNDGSQPNDATGNAANDTSIGLPESPRRY
jgi:hypothetical protein